MTFPMVAFATGFLGAMLGDLAALGLRFGILGGEKRFVQDSCSTVDGSEIRRSPVDMVNIPAHYLQGCIHNRWLFGISEPARVSFYIILQILSLLLCIRCHIHSHTTLFQKPQKYVISVFL